MTKNEYLQTTQPAAEAKSVAWRTAVGLQAVDALKPSDYLLQIAQKDIEGSITLDDAEKAISSYYASRQSRTPDEAGAEEADKASINIRRLLTEESFVFGLQGLLSTHRRIFQGIYDFAGQLRTFDITKREWVLRGDTVRYAPAVDLQATVEYDLERERRFCYVGLSAEQTVAHVARFVADLWQIHPFAEGNTRATAVFVIKYLRYLGFDVGNELFEAKSWYFRNALVRANYANAKQGVAPDISFLEKFLRNLLYAEAHELRSRDLQIAEVAK